MKINAEAKNSRNRVKNLGDDHSTISMGLEWLACFVSFLLVEGKEDFRRRLAGVNGLAGRDLFFEALGGLAVLAGDFLLRFKRLEWTARSTLSKERAPSSPWWLACSLCSSASPAESDADLSSASTSSSPSSMSLSSSSSSSLWSSSSSSLSSSSEDVSEPMN